MGIHFNVDKVDSGGGKSSLTADPSLVTSLPTAHDGFCCVPGQQANCGGVTEAQCSQNGGILFQSIGDCIASCASLIGGSPTSSSSSSSSGQPSPMPSTPFPPSASPSMYSSFSASSCSSGGAWWICCPPKWRNFQGWCYEAAVPCDTAPWNWPCPVTASSSCMPCNYIYKAFSPRVQRIKIRVPRLFTEDEVKGKWIVLPPKEYNNFAWNYAGSSSHSSSFTQILGECGKWQYYKIIRPVMASSKCCCIPQSTWQQNVNYPYGYVVRYDPLPEEAPFECAYCVCGAAQLNVLPSAMWQDKDCASAVAENLLGSSFCWAGLVRPNQITGDPRITCNNEGTDLICSSTNGDCTLGIYARISMHNDHLTRGDVVILDEHRNATGYPFLVDIYRGKNPYTARPRGPLYNYSFYGDERTTEFLGVYSIGFSCPVCPLSGRPLSPWRNEWGVDLFTNVTGGGPADTVAPHGLPPAILPKICGMNTGLLGYGHQAPVFLPGLGLGIVPFASHYATGGRTPTTDSWYEYGQPGSLLHGYERRTIHWKPNPSLKLCGQQYCFGVTYGGTYHDRYRMQDYDGGYTAAGGGGGNGWGREWCESRGGQYVLNCPSEFAVGGPSHHIFASYGWSSINLCPECSCSSLPPEDVCWDIIPPTYPPTGTPDPPATPPPPVPPVPPVPVVNGFLARICDGQNLTTNHMFLPWSPLYTNLVGDAQFWGIKKGSNSLCISTIESSSATANGWEIMDLQYGPHQDCGACDFNPGQGGNP
jgi:hypothetical protein